MNEMYPIGSFVRLKPFDEVIFRQAWELSETGDRQWMLELYDDYKDQVFEVKRIYEGIGVERVNSKGHRMGWIEAHVLIFDQCIVFEDAARIV